MNREFGAGPQNASRVPSLPSFYACRLSRTARHRGAWFWLAGDDGLRSPIKGFPRETCGAASALCFSLVSWHALDICLGMAVHGGLSDGSSFHDRHALRFARPETHQATSRRGTRGHRPGPALSTRSDWFSAGGPHGHGRSGSPNTSLLWAGGVLLSAWTVLAIAPNGHPPGVLPATSTTGPTTPNNVDGAGVRCAESSPWSSSGSLFDHGRSERQHDCQRPELMNLQMQH